MAAFRLVRFVSVLAEEIERLFEAAFIAARAPSTLADEVESATDEPC